MSKPPELVLIKPEDFKKDDRETVQQLAEVLNNFILQITQLLNQSLTFSDNFNSELRYLTMVGGESVKFKLNTGLTPAGLILLQYRNTTDPAETLTSAVGMPQWASDGKGNITVEAIPGLTASENYSIILLVISG